MEGSETSETASKSNGKLKKHGSFSSISSRTSSSDSLFSEDSSYLSMPSPPDGGYGWIIVLASFFTNMISDGIGFSFGILYAELLQQFDESRSLTSWVGSIFYGTCLMGGPLASALATKFGCRKVLMVGGFVAAVACFASSFADSISALCVLFGFFTGLGMSMGYVTSVVMVAFYFEDKRALATGLSVCGSGIGTFLFAPLTNYLIDTYGWRGTLMLWSGIILNLMVCGALLKPLEFTEQEKRQKALQKFERMSKTISHASFSVTATANSRPISQTDSLDVMDGCLEEDLEHCHSQIQIPTFIKEQEINIPIELLKEAKNNNDNSMLTQYIQAICEEKELKQAEEASAKVETAGAKVETVVHLQNGEEKVALIRNGHHTNKSKPKGSCLKKSATTPGGSKDDAKQQNRPKQVHISTYLPLYRKDIFFRGNLSRLKMQPIDQVRSTSCPELYKSQWGDSDSESSDEEDSLFWRYLHFSKHVKRVLKTMFDPSILMHPMFVIYALSNFVLYFWIDIPYIFIADRSLELGMTQSEASFLVSILGIVNTLGQILYGFIGDMNVNLSLLYGFSVMACGIAILLVPFFTAFLPLAVLSGAFGLFISVNYSLSTVILVEFLGLDKLSNAYGLNMLGQGIANLVGPPVAGFLYDDTESYDATFFTGGGFIVLSGLMLLLVPFLRHCCNRLDLELKTKKFTAYNTYMVTDTEEKESSPEETACSANLEENLETFV